MRFLKIKEDKIINLDRIEIARVPETDFGGKLNIFMANSTDTISFSNKQQARLALETLRKFTDEHYETTYEIFERQGYSLKEYIQQLEDDKDEKESI